jgi:alkylation response protein AidB-like acyl-CoA dehydrogenase
MDLHLTLEQEQLVDAFNDLFERYAHTDRIRETETAGFDEALWTRVAELGIVEMGIKMEHGGWGASMLDLALVAEQHGRHLAPIPTIEVLVAARLLAQCEDPRAREVLAEMKAGRLLAVFVPREARGGVSALTPGGSIADVAIVFADQDLFLVTLEGHRSPVGNIGSMPLADIVLSDNAMALATSRDPRRIYDAALNEWLVLMASALVGLSSRALQIGVSYVKERKAWGSPIGSFQAVAHPLADSATAIDGAKLLAYKAAWALDMEGLGEPVPGLSSGELAPMSFAFATETACEVTYRSLHFHGGYGFMIEYDIQMYYRRARAWAGVFCEPRLAYELAANRRYSEAATDPLQASRALEV